MLRARGRIAARGLRSPVSGFRFPVSNCHEGRGIVLSTFFSLLVLAADVWAIVNILQSDDKTVTKVVWTIVVIVLPILGLIIWYFAGPRPAGR